MFWYSFQHYNAEHLITSYTEINGKHLEIILQTQVVVSEIKENMVYNEDNKQEQMFSLRVG